MKQFEYAMLEKRVDRFGHKWEFGQSDKDFEDWSLLRVLNYLGEQGWELAVKDSDYSYVLKTELPNEL